MSQGALKNIRKYNRLSGKEYLDKTSKLNYKKCNWKQKTIINNLIKERI